MEPGSEYKNYSEVISRPLEAERLLIITTPSLLFGVEKCVFFNLLTINNYIITFHS